ncbi:hypothetical protein BIY21_20825 [Vibrio ponticus]|uniref:Apea-like HEPN domain-containing protein n=2 Tax=Vibrio ponticus TaxID=265668 RepID=A0ABX3FMZ1_9VIBR|nr:hypothetical protein BIY21_20825 [Vibrio ponticus]
MRVRVPTVPLHSLGSMMAKKSPYLHKLTDEVGGSIHSLNTIAVSLSHLSNSTTTPAGLNITWKPVNVGGASKNARRFAIRSSIVFHAEMLFEYLSELSKDPFWSPSGINFNIALKSQDSKAKRVSAFCKSIPGIEREWVVLTELMCHWRNKIVHAKSNANISSKDKQFLQSKSNDIYKDYYHFDVDKAISDFRADKVTLKEATTLTTFLIKCCNAIDDHYLNLVNNTKIADVISILNKERDFVVLTKQSKGEKRTRQIERWLEVNYSIFSPALIKDLVEHYT